MIVATGRYDLKTPKPADTKLKRWIFSAQSVGEGYGRREWWEKGNRRRKEEVDIEVEEEEIWEGHMEQEEVEMINDEKGEKEEKKGGDRENVPILILLRY